MVNFQLSIPIEMAKPGQTNRGGHSQSLVSAHPMPTKFNLV
jgi:hypothetical protein